MSILTAVQSAARLCGQPVPSSALMSTDKTGLLMAELARVDAEDLAGRYDWPNLTKERSFTTLAGIDQTGALPADFARFANRTDDRGTLYDVARMEGIAGPANEAQWRSIVDGLQGWSVTWRLFGGVLQMAPAPPAGRTMRFEYVSNALWRPTSGADKTAPTQDTDTCLIPESLIALGIVWRWKQGRGFEYGEDLRTAELQIERAIGQSAGGRRVLISGRPRLRAEEYAWPGVLGLNPGP